MTTIPKFPVRDMKLEALVDLAHEHWNIPRFTDPRLVSVSDSMRANIARVRNTMLIPTTIAGYVDEVRIWLDQAEFDVTGSASPPNHVFEPDVKAKIERRFVELHEASRIESEKLLGTEAWDANVLAHHKNSLNVIGAIARAPLGAHAFLAMFSAHITGTWTAIESMCGDLWEASLNSHPRILASLQGQAGRIGKSSVMARDRAPSGDDSKSVPLNLIQMNDFDIRSRMGTILRTKFEFTRLANIRQAYSCAFSEKSSRIDTALADKSLDAINVVRNALVHKAGIADAEYLKRAETLKIPKPKIGSPIPLDGDVVATLIRQP